MRRRRLHLALWGLRPRDRRLRRRLREPFGQAAGQRDRHRLERWSLELRRCARILSLVVKRHLLPRIRCASGIPNAGSVCHRRLLVSQDHRGASDGFHARRRRGVIGPRQVVARLLGRNPAPFRRGEDRHEADFRLRIADGVPRNPYAVRRTQLGFAEVLGELLGGERKFAIGGLAVLHGARIVVRIDGEVSINWNRLVRAVIEVQPPAKAASRRLARLVVDCRRPDGDHPHRLLIVARGLFRVRVGPGQMLGPIAADAFAAGSGERREQDQRRQSQVAHWANSIGYYRGSPTDRLISRIDAEKARD